MADLPDRLPAIPVLDVRDGGPAEHARLRHEAMLDLRERCFAVAPRPLHGLARPLDRVSRAWLRRGPSPYVSEIDRIAALAGRPGIWFINASYEWGCTTRVDPEPLPTLRRTLDWPFPGLGRRVEIALQHGGAGPYANVTWPGAAGVLTALAPGRFAAAINQAPLRRRSAATALVPLDLLLNNVECWRRDDRWPAAHLLRRAFDDCRTFDEAVDLLARTPVAKPVLFSVAGTRPGEACLIERTELEAFVHRGGRCAVANDWHPDGPSRPGRWLCRGALIRGPEDSERRRAQLQAHEGAAPFGWLQEPVLNGLTRLAVEACPATGDLAVLGFEPDGPAFARAVPATEAFHGVVGADGAVAPEASRAAA